MVFNEDSVNETYSADQVTHYYASRAAAASLSRGREPTDLVRRVVVKPRERRQRSGVAAFAAFNVFRRWFPWAVAHG